MQSAEFEGMRMNRSVAGRPEAAAVVWQWATPASLEPGADPATSRIRVRGLLQALVGGIVGFGVFRLVSPTVGVVVLGIAGVIGLTALVSPTGLFAGIERMFAALGGLTGKILTWLFLVPLFYGFFLPFGRLMRRGRRDRMRRFLDPSAESYWEHHEGPMAGSGSRKRQY
jgi:hypothetical protein